MGLNNLGPWVLGFSGYPKYGFYFGGSSADSIRELGYCAQLGAGCGIITLATLLMLRVDEPPTNTSLHAFLNPHPKPETTRALRRAHAKAGETCESAGLFPKRFRHIGHECFDGQFGLEIVHVTLCQGIKYMDTS